MDIKTNWKNMLSSNELKCILLFGLILMLIGIGLHISGRTLLNVDQIYCRDYYPWKALYPEKNCSPERDGDYMFQSSFIATELDYLAKNPYQQSYTERVMGGYPIASAYAGDPYTLTRGLDKFIPITSSANFVALTYIFISFLIGYAISRTLKFTPGYSVVFGCLSITSLYVLLFEAFNLSLVGFGLVTLGILQYYRCNRKYLFIILTLFGAVCIMLSAVFQYYIYAALCILLLFIMSFWAEEKKKFFTTTITVGIIFVVAALFLNSFLINHSSFLAVSNKINTKITLSEFIKHKGYSLDPLGWIGYEPVQLHHKIAAMIFGDNFGYLSYGSVTSGNSNSPGPVFLVLFFIGIVALWRKDKIYRPYVIFVFFWLLYAAGYLQLLLSLLGSPFKEETSIVAFNLFFLFGIFAVIYAAKSLMNNEIILNKKWKLLIKLFFLYLIVSMPIFIVIRYYGHKQVLLETVFVIVSSVLFLIWLHIKERSAANNTKRYILFTILLSSLLIIPFARMFLGVTPDIFSLNKSNLYYPETKFEDTIKKYPELNRVVLIQTPESGRTQHQNGPVFLGLSTITGYQNPMYKGFTDLYYYHRFIFEGSTSTTQDFDKLTKSVSYLNDDLSALKAPQSKITLTEASKRFFAMTGVNSVIGPIDLQITNPEWEKITSADNLTLWHLKKPNQEFFFVQQEVVIPTEVGQFEYIFNNPGWNPEKSAVLNSSVLENNNINGRTNQTISIIKKDDGYRLIKTVNIASPGILTLPVTFDKHWVATFYNNNGTSTLKTFVSNTAFLGILVPEGSGTIEAKYSDSSGIKNYLLLGAGILVLIFVSLYLNRIDIYSEENIL